MNPYGPTGMFQGNADVAANSFSGQPNVASLYPGWGIDPSLRTPAYDAPYRPAYAGPNPYMAVAKPSFNQSAGQLFNPFFANPYYGNPIDNNAMAATSMGTKPFDAMMHTGQNFIAPAVSIGLAMAYMQKPLGTLSGGVASGLARGMGFGATATRAIGSAARFAGGFGLAFSAGLLGAEALSDLVAQPYIRSRQMTEDINANFGGITLSGVGNNISGRGMSRGQAAGLAGGIDAMGIRDSTFGANQYNAIASMGMRSGLFDDVSSIGGIKNRVADVAAQIKTILAISKDPNIASAIEELGKLRLGGASVTGGIASQAGSAYSSMGMYASIAGATVQRVMNTVGVQGQYMYQMNGLTPYLGQLAAGNAYAGFASAQRMGVLSTAQLARMGGLEGATQSALSAQITGGSTQYNQMSLMNRFFGTGQAGSVVGNITNFGNLASSNPLATQGAMALYGGAMTSQQSKAEGSLSLENQISQRLSLMGRRQSGGKYSAEEAAAVMQSMGMTPEQITAYAALRQSQTSADGQTLAMKAIRAQAIEQAAQTIDQYDAYGGPIESRIAAVRKGIKNIYAETATTFSHRLNNESGSFSDRIAKFAFNFRFNDSLSAELTTESGSSSRGLDMRRIYDDKSGAPSWARRGEKIAAQKILAQLDKVARSGGPGAEAAKKLLEGDFEGEEARQQLLEFVRIQDDPMISKHAESMDYSTDLFDTVKRLGKGATVDISKQRSSEDVAMLKVEDQAARLHLEGGALSTSVSRLLKSPQYAELNSSLSGSDNEKMKRIRELAMAKARRSGRTIGDQTSREGLNAILAGVYGQQEAEERVGKEGNSSIDWQGSGKVIASLDSGSRLIYDAARIFSDAVTRGTMPGYSKGIEKQNTQK